MRVRAPGDGAPPPDSIDRADAVDETAPADEVAPGEAIAGVEPLAPADAPGAADPISAVARRLRAGEINAREALDLIIDDVVERQIGRAVADRRAMAAEL